MKTYCKTVDLFDKNRITEIIYLFLKGDGKRPSKWNQKKFKRFMAKGSDLRYKEVDIAVKRKDYEILDIIVGKLADEFIYSLKRLIFLAIPIEFEPIKHRYRYDEVSGKLRNLCIVSVRHQMYEFIAKESLQELFDTKFEPNQCASIRERGQVLGKKKIENWVRKKQYKYYVKLDIVHCFNEFKVLVIEELLQKDIRNKNLLIFVFYLLSLYTNGALEIGMILSAPFCNYAFSYLMRYADSLRYQRRGKELKVFEKQLFYMDDLAFFGNNRKQMDKGVKCIEKYLNDKYNLHIHEYQIYEVKKKPIDMLGYIIYFDHTEIRPRIYKRAKKAYIKAFNLIKRDKVIPLYLAQKVISYKGYFDNSDSEKAKKNLHVQLVFNKAKKRVSHDAKEETDVLQN